MLAGRDIAIPGSDMYDTLENLGIEEEEYNFYSLGNYDHNDLQENTGETDAVNYHWYIMTLKGNTQKQPRKNYC
jgi:hypothetical protein